MHEQITGFAPLVGSVLVPHIIAYNLNEAAIIVYVASQLSQVVMKAVNTLKAYVYTDNVNISSLD